jgi:hypothetical protein
MENPALVRYSASKDQQTLFFYKTRHNPGLAHANTSPDKEPQEDGADILQSATHYRWHAVIDQPRGHPVSGTDIGWSVR